jgi:hypothetical protein
VKKAYQSFALLAAIAVGLHVCWAQTPSPVRIQKAPAQVATNTITANDLNRLAAEQTRALEKQTPCLVMATTNRTFAHAMSYILADMAGHKPEKLPPEKGSTHSMVQLGVGVRVGAGARIMHATEIAGGVFGSNVSRDEPRGSAGGHLPG